MEIIIIGWIYGLDKLTDGLNKNTKILKLGSKWIFIVKYVLPLILGVMWISGMYSLIKTGDTFSLVMQIIIILILIVVPYIFTKLPAESDDY